jgi:hypothetical protein
MEFCASAGVREPGQWGSSSNAGGCIWRRVQNLRTRHSAEGIISKLKKKAPSLRGGNVTWAHIWNDVDIEAWAGSVPRLAVGSCKGLGRSEIVFGRFCTSIVRMAFGSQSPNKFPYVNREQRNLECDREMLGIRCWYWLRLASCVILCFF